MRVVKENVYYCDYCKKRSLRSLKGHEQRCTGNPNRECRVCGKVAGYLPPLIEQLRPEFEWYYEEAFSAYTTLTKHPDVDRFLELLESPDGCFACAMAALKALSPDPGSNWPDWFDYTAWKQEWWNAHDDY